MQNFVNTLLPIKLGLPGYFSKQKLNLWANLIFLSKKFCRLKNSFYLRIGIVNEIVNNNGTKYENVRKTVPQIRIFGKEIRKQNIFI